VKHEKMHVMTFQVKGRFHWGKLSPKSKYFHYCLRDSESKRKKKSARKEPTYSVGSSTKHKELTRNWKLNEEEVFGARTGLDTKQELLVQSYDRNHPTRRHNRTDPKDPEEESARGEKIGIRRTELYVFFL
jgi:hypothetical protein